MPLTIQEDLSIRRDGLYLNFAPSKISQKLSLYNQDNHTLFFLCSPLLGQGCKGFLEQAHTSQAFIIFVELDVELYTLFSHQNSLLNSFASEHVFLAPSPHSETILNFVEDLFEQETIKNVQFISLSRGYKLHHKTYYLLKQEILILMKQSWHNRLTRQYLGRRWIKNLFKNLCKPSTVNLKREWKKASVLLGAGPSAEKMLDHLLPYRQDYHLVAVDSALPHLSERGIKPDLIISQDAQIFNCADFLPFKWANIPLLCDITTHPAIPHIMRRRFFFLSSFATLNLIQRVKKQIPVYIPALGSVGVTMCYLLLLFTKAPLICAGLELCYTRGASHLRMSARHRFFALRSQRLVSGQQLIDDFEKPHLLFGKMHTNSVFMEYARNLKKIAMTSALLYDMSQGIKHIPKRINQKEAELLIRSYKREVSEEIWSDWKSDITTSRLFLEEEAETLRSFLNKNTPLPPQLDYITIDLVDKTKREDLILSAADYLSFILRLLSGTTNNG